MTRAFRVAAVLAALALGWLLAPTSLGGSQSYVTTYGISMEPGFHAGDLGLLRVADGYAVGDVVGYRSATLHAVVLHRIVGVQGDAFVMKGDHNTWLDVDHPTTRDVVGRLVLRVPHGGTVFGWLLTPPALVAALLALAASLLLAGRQRSRSRSGVARRRRPRRNRHRSADPLASTWLVTLRDRLGALATPSERQVAVLAGAAVLVGLGAVLLLVARFGPVTQPAARPATPARTMTFSYSASVPGTPAFDGTTIRSPDPVFRKLATLVTVHYAYRGGPGVLQISAALYGQSGWHSALPLALPGQVAVSGNGFDGEVRLDLDALGRRALAAAAATGSSDEQVGVRIVPRVSLTDGSAFAPSLTLVLTKQQLSVQDAASLVVTDPGARAPEPLRVKGSVVVLGHAVGVRLAERTALILLALGLLLGLVAILDAVRAHPPDEVTVIRRRYGPLLVAAEPIGPPPDRPLVELSRFATLARIARSYGLLVMHWQRDGAVVFVVWDDAASYRYQVLPAPPTRRRRLGRRHRASARPARPVAPEPVAVSVWSRQSAAPPPVALVPPAVFAPTAPSVGDVPQLPVAASAPRGRWVARRAAGPRSTPVGRRVARRGHPAAEQQLIAWRQQQREVWAVLRRRRRGAQGPIRWIPTQRTPGVPGSRAGTTASWDSLVSGRPG